MTLGNAKVLYKHFKGKGMEVEAAQLERRFPELKGSFKEPEKEAQKGSEQPKKKGDIKSGVDPEKDNAIKNKAKKGKKR